MNTGTFNKIVQSNFNLKPWILSKNTNEIVNTYIEKIYKQIPNNFKNDLLKGRVATPRAENRGPLRYFCSQEPNEVPTIRAQKLKTRHTGERLSTNFVVNKKLLKSANYKIYGSRRFGSSASSSNASIFRRFDERRRNRNQTQVTSRRPISLNSQKSAFAANSGIAKFLMPIRNQHMQSHLGSVPQAIEVSNNIQRDLMIIDNVLKDRISVIKSKLIKLVPETSSSNRKSSAFGWDHPPSPDFFVSRWNERNRASIELQEQHRKLRLPQKMQGTTSYNSYSRSNFGLSNVNKRRLRLDDGFRSSPRHQQIPLNTSTVIPPGRYSIQKSAEGAAVATIAMHPKSKEVEKTATASVSKPAEKPTEHAPASNGSPPPVASNTSPITNTATSMLVSEALANGLIRSRYNHSLFYKANRY